MTGLELDLREGWVAPEIAAEFPELGLVYAQVEARPGRSPRAVRERLSALADRYTGGRVVHMRQDAVPWAYRVFSRQVGIDPDAQRTPVEEIALERLRQGGMRSHNLVDDALTIAIAETGVPVIALDAALVDGELGLRLSQRGEALSELRPLVRPLMVVADERRALAVVLGDVGEHAGVTPAARRLLVCALLVKGVPRIAAEEALWTAGETLTGA